MTGRRYVQEHRSLQHKNAIRTRIVQWDTRVYSMEHEENKHWGLEEDGNGQVGYVTVAYLMIIIDETLQEEESDTTGKEGYEKSTDGTKIGREN